MLIKGIIRHKGYEEKFKYFGNFALETMIEHMLEKYYGKNVSIRVIDLLKEKKED